MPQRYRHSAQGLAADVPQLVMPMSHDQPDNTCRLKRPGVGDFLWLKQFRGPAVVGKLEQLLSSTSVQARCRELAQCVIVEQALAENCTVLRPWSCP
jgi:rhamnosyltransferase subunit B